MIPLLPAVKKRTEGFRKAAVQVQGVWNPSSKLYVAIFCSFMSFSFFYTIWSKEEGGASYQAQGTCASVLRLSSFFLLLLKIYITLFLSHEQV